MILQGNVIHNIGDYIVIGTDQIAKKRIRFDYEKKRYEIVTERFDDKGTIDKKKYIVLEYIGNGNFRESITGTIITVDPYNDNLIAPIHSIRGYEEEYEHSYNPPIDKAIEYPLTIRGSLQVINLDRIRKIAEAQNPEIIRQLSPEEVEILRNSIYQTPNSQEKLSEFLKNREVEARTTIEKDYAAMVAKEQNVAEQENANLRAVSAFQII